MGISLRSQEKQLFLGVYVDDIHLPGNENNIAPMWKEFGKHISFGDSTSFDDTTHLGCSQKKIEVPTELGRSKNSMVTC